MTRPPSEEVAEVAEVAEGAEEAVEVHRWAGPDGEDRLEGQDGRCPRPEQYSLQQETTSCSETRQEFLMEIKLKHANS